MNRPLLIAVAASGLLVPTAASAAAGDLDIRIEPDPRPGAISSELAINLTVTVTDRARGAAPEENFEVYAFADHAGGRTTEIFPCGQEHDHSPEVPRGIYMCTVIVDHGGTWNFHGVVNEFRTDPRAAPVRLGQVSHSWAIDTTEVAPSPPDRPIEARVAEVALLWGHAASAGGWFVAVGLLAALALPGARRRLSAFGLHRLEERLGLLVRAAWLTTGLLVASGAYLLATQTAYDTPLSASAIDAVFNLPYGRPYFLALAVKLALYALMVAAIVPLLREAHRRLRVGPDGAPEPEAGRAGRSVAADSSPWRPTARPAPGTGAAVAVAAAPMVSADPAPEAATPGPVRLGTLILAAGAVGISMCVTFLKYFHQLIEATRATL